MGNVTVLDPAKKQAQRSLLKVYDPLTKQPERGIEHEGLSPMDPPENPYEPPGLDSLAGGELHPFLKRLSDEHLSMSKELDALEAELQAVELDGFTTKTDRALMHFMAVMDKEFIPHSREEEVSLFPTLNEWLIAAGEHSKGALSLTTPVDVMMDEHLKAIQHAAVALNFLRVGSVLPDERSARIMINSALKETANLVELLRLHMFREDHIVFVSAQRLIPTAEMDALGSGTPRPRKA